MLFKALGQLKQRRSAFQDVLAHVLGRGIKTAAHELCQVAVQSAHRWADRHVVVVQNHQQLAIFNACIIHGLKGHACRHGAITNDRNGMTRFALLARRNGHTQGGRNAGGRMRGTEGVVLALVASGKTRQTTQLTKRGHALTPTRQNFVWICLVAYVPHNAVFWRIENVMQSHREFDGTQVRA